MKSVFAIVGILTLASCSSTEEIFTENVGDNNKSVKMTFTAKQENSSATRTGIGDDGGKTKIWWSAEDKIRVFNGSTSNDFTLSTGENTTSATFTGVLAEAENYYAIYPSQENVTLSGSTFKGVQLKAEQKATIGSFDPEAAIMVAKNNDKNFSFKNVIAYFKVTPTYNCSEIVVTAHKSTDALAGTFDVALGSDGTTSISNVTEKSREVKLTGDIKANNTYYILLLPGTFEYGFSVTLQPESDANTKYFKQKNTSFELKSNDLWNLGNMSDATEVSENTIPYIKLSASDEHTISLAKKTSVNSLQYSVGNGPWTDMTEGSTVTYGGQDNDLRLRAKSENGILGPDVDWHRKPFNFGGGTGEVNCTGDIRTLVDYDNYYKANTSSATFQGLFNGFTSLKTTPDLPILELYSSCYKSMFKDCTSLVTTTKLPATTLKSDCYSNMFRGCTMLTSAPELPAATLSSGCYLSMFLGCTSLTTAPILKATILASSCYSYMFQGCTNLSSVTMLAQDISSNYCLRDWLKDAGTNLTKRELTLANKNIYDSMIANTTNVYIPDIWKETDSNTTVVYQNQ